MNNDENFSPICTYMQSVVDDTCKLLLRSPILILNHVLKCFTPSINLVQSPMKTPCFHHFMSLHC